MLFCKSTFIAPNPQVMRPPRDMARSTRHLPPSGSHEASKTGTRRARWAAAPRPRHGGT